MIRILYTASLVLAGSVLLATPAPNEPLWLTALYMTVAFLLLTGAVVFTAPEERE